MKSSTTLIFGQSYASPNPNSGQIYLEQQMAAIYADLGNREVVWTKVQEALGMNWLPKYVVRSLPNTALIEVTVTDTDPERARIVADEVARQLILRTPKTAGSNDQEQQTFIQEQIATLQAQIQSTEQDIATHRAKLGDLTSARLIREAETQIAALETKLTTLQTTYASLIGNTASGALNSLTVIQPAMTPTVPSGPSKSLIMALAGAIGLVLGTIGAYAIEYFDHSIRTVDEVVQLTGLAVIGRITKITNEKRQMLHALDDPFSPLSNAFRSLRSQLEILGVGRSVRTVLIFSPGVSEGKSTISLNLAAIFSKIKKRLILVDTDFYKSTMSAVLNIPDSSGLIDILEGKIELTEALVPVAGGDVMFLPSGGIRAGASDMLGSERMESLLIELKTDTDVVIIDCPPFILADAMDLGTRVDAVIMVVRAEANIKVGSGKDDGIKSAEWRYRSWGL